MAGTSDLDVAYVARLARINLTEDEAKIFQKQLDDVLKYVEKLRQLDVTGVDASAHGLPVFNVFRADAPRDRAGRTGARPSARDGATRAADDGDCEAARDVVAAGRDPAKTPVREIAEPPRYTLDPELPLDEAFRFLEDEDLERVPVTENGRLVGVLSRSSLQRRLAEDEPPPLDEDPGTGY